MKYRYREKRVCEKESGSLFPVVNTLFPYSFSVRKQKVNFIQEVQRNILYFNQSEVLKI